MLTLLDYVVIGFYFAFILGIGLYFRRATGDSSDFFRGGGAMPWWLVGTSSFMGAFSAWTFTGSAGVAYERGLVVLTIYWANALAAYFLAWAFAGRFRQLRLITPIEAVRQRLGVTNEQLGIWLGFPISVVRSAVWLYGLAIFLAPVFHVDLTKLIIISGVCMVVVSACGGSWAVITSDFMQAMVVLPITIVAAYLALVRVGGLHQLVEKLPADHFDFTASRLPGFGVLWLVAMLAERLIGQGIGVSGKFLCARDGREARRACVLHGTLMVFGSLLWFIPPLAARSLNLDLAHLFPELSKPSEAAYAAIAVITLPPGVLGLLVTSLIATTLSSMDTGLNANAGMLVRGAYLPLLRPTASERELVTVARVITIVMGVLIVLLALRYSSWKDLGVFTIMFNVSAMLGLPSAVPSFWCMLTKRSPDWAFWSTMLLGLAVGAVIGVLPRQEWFVAYATHDGWGPTLHWLAANEYATITVANIVICSAWFWLATLLVRRNPLPPRRQQEVETFFTNLNTPLPPNEEAVPSGRMLAIAKMCFAYGVFVAAIALLPNSGRGHECLGFCALFLLATGALVRAAVLRESKKHALLLQQADAAAVE